VRNGDDDGEREVGRPDEQALPGEEIPKLVGGAFNLDAAAVWASDLGLHVRTYW
jgi:hypothetical protein